MLFATVTRLARRGRQRPPAEAGPRSTQSITVYAEHRILEGDPVIPDPIDEHERPSSEMAPVALRNVLATDLGDGRARGSADYWIVPTEITAISSIAPRDLAGSARRHRVTLRTGPYYVQGYVNAEPSANLIASLRNRSRIDLSDTLIEYTVAGRLRRDRWPSLAVRQEGVESLAEAWDPQIPRRTW